jgi:hypothetical protein
MLFFVTVSDYGFSLNKFMYSLYIRRWIPSVETPPPVGFRWNAIMVAVTPC